MTEPASNSQSATTSSQIGSNACPDPIECQHEAALGQAEERAEQVSGIVLAAERRAEHAEAERDAAITRAEQAEARARGDAESSDAAFGLLEERSAERDAAEYRIHRAQQVLRRYMGCGSHTAAALRAEITAALHGPASTPAAPVDSPAALRIAPGVARIVAEGKEYIAYPVGSGGHGAWNDGYTAGMAAAGQHAAAAACLARSLVADPDRVSWAAHAEVDVRAQVAALLAEGKSPETHGHGEPETAEQLHARRAHPGWEYATTQGQRKAWDDEDMTPEGGGWERNTAAGRDGWERFDYTEESYWRRIIADKRCAICGTHQHGGRTWYESAQGWLSCWPCADGDRPTCPTGERCEGVNCYRRNEHGPRPSEGSGS